MNYIAEIKAFYDRLEFSPLPGSAISLWHALMAMANKAGWPDTFTAPQSVLMAKSGLGASSFKRAREKLSEDGFIAWEMRGGNLSAQYRIIGISAQKDTQNSPQPTPCFELQINYEPKNGPQNGPQSGLQSGPQNGPQNGLQCDFGPQSEPQNEPQCGPQTGPQSEPQMEPEEFVVQNEGKNGPQNGPQSGPINKHKHKLNIKDIPPYNPPTRFEEFWSVYPNKQRRGLAERAYCALMVSGDVDECDLLEAAGNYAEYVRESGDKMYMPNNWLEKYVFEDFLPGNYAGKVQGDTVPAGARDAPADGKGQEPEDEELVGDDWINCNNEFWEGYTWD